MVQYNCNEEIYIVIVRFSFYFPFLSRSKEKLEEELLLIEIKKVFVTRSPQQVSIETPSIPWTLLLI